MQKTFFPVLLAMVLALTGCAAHRASSSIDVTSSMIIPEGAVRNVLDERQRFIMPTSIEAPEPAYPVDALRAGQQAVVCVSFVVTADGHVTDVEQIDSAVGCSSLQEQRTTPFRVSVADTLPTWAFFGAAICSYQQADDEC
ncbi:hypothetical protein DBR33_11620, partial [Stenotrophomonas sp. HMWF022]